MKFKEIILLFGLIFSAAVQGSAQSKIDPKEISNKMQWFADAKLGIFIHAGIYSVNGIDESWSFHNKKISHADYMKQLNGFTALAYEPELRADLAQSKNEISTLKKETGERLAAMNDNIAHADKNLQTMLVAKIAELGQKVADSGKKLDDQILAAHKKTDELKTALAREIEAIRSKFE